MHRENTSWITDFFLLLFAALASHALAAHTYYMAHYAAEHSVIAPNGFDVVEIAVYVAVFLLMKYLLNSPLDRARKTWQALGVLLAVTMLQWLAIIFHHFFRATLRGHFHWDPSDSPLAITAFLTLVLAFAFFALRHHSELAIIGQEDAAGVEGLVLFLSFLPVGGKERICAVWTESEWRDTPEWIATKQKLQAVTGSTTDSATCTALDFGNWRMPVEAIGHHVAKETLKHVAVICSRNSAQDRADGSIMQFQEFLSLVERLGWTSVHNIHPVGIDFEDSRQVSSAVQRALDTLHKAGAKSAYVDVTGGTKICTGIGAALTMEVGRKFQYVSTTTHKVQSFDIRHDPAKTSSTTNRQCS